VRAADRAGGTSSKRSSTIVAAVRRVAAVDRVDAFVPPRAIDPARAVDRDVELGPEPREAVDLPARAVPDAALPERRVPVDRRPEAAFDCDAGAAERRAVDLGLMTLRINRIRHRSPVHLTGHIGGVSVS
jgi:hypothetical protein